MKKICLVVLGLMATLGALAPKAEAKGGGWDLLAYGAYRMVDIDAAGYPKYHQFGGGVAVGTSFSAIAIRAGFDYILPKKKTVLTFSGVGYTFMQPHVAVGAKFGGKSFETHVLGKASLVMIKSHINGVSTTGSDIAIGALVGGTMNLGGSVGLLIEGVFDYILDSTKVMALGANVGISIGF